MSSSSSSSSLLCFMSSSSSLLCFMGHQAAARLWMLLLLVFGVLSGIGGFKYENVSLSDVPRDLDWRTLGAVTPIIKQEKCGCCWACAAVAAVEGISKIDTGELIPLSVQQLVDCDSNNYGCNGGEAVRAFIYIINNEGLTSESDYPYIAAQGTCQRDKESHFVTTINDFEWVPENSELDLLKAVSHQPVVAHVKSSLSFQKYTGGVFKGGCGLSSHAVTVVGYGTDNNGIDYWLLKNSWGTDWGEHGFMRMQRNIGLCGIAMKALYPIIY